MFKVKDTNLNWIWYA